MKSIAMRSFGTRKALLYGLFVGVLLVFLGACDSEDPTPTATSAPPPQPQATATPIPQPTADGSMRESQPAPEPTAAPTATPTSVPTEAPAAAPTTPTQPEVPPVTYEGKTVRLFINWPAGSSADTFGRLMSRHLGRFLPGNPRVIVANRAGASGLVGAMTLYNARPDGTNLGVFTAVNAGNQMTRPDWTYDIRQANILIGFQGQTSIWFVRGDAPYNRIQDAIGQGSAGGPTFTYGTGDVCTLGTVRVRAVKEWLDLPVDIKYGFEGNRASVWLSLERGDYQSSSSSGWYTLPIDRPGWLSSGFLEPFAYVNPEGTAVFEGNSESDLPSDLMYISELLNTEQEELYRRFSAETLGPQHRSVHAPPGTPPEYVAFLRDAFFDMFHDEQFEVDLVKLRGDEPLDIRRGEEMQQLVADALSDVRGTLLEAQRYLPECDLDIPES